VAAGLAAKLPVSDVLLLAKLARRGQAAIAEFQAQTGSAVLRDACQQVLDCLGADETEYLAGCLAGAVRASGRGRGLQEVDVVWTGPESDVDTGRLTSAVVSELIKSARHELLLVSYATYPERDVLLALQDACTRHVDVTVVFERNVDNAAYRGSDEGLAGLGLRRVVWPAVNRPLGASLHPKLVVVDKQVALVGSANLTGRALDTNIECGVLLRGGPQPRAISEHIWGLVRSGVLTVLPN
jgi:phosphatidylserine/phosphatidylglycerophosphate/cardiolipin synthase-like enzyme